MGPQYGKQKLTRCLALLLFLFGVMTFKTGSFVLFDDISRLSAGNIFLVIAWFNILAGLLYFLSAWGLWAGRPWVRKVSLFLFAAHLVIMIFLMAHVFRGGPYEMRTIYSLSFRILLWGGVLFITRIKAQFIPVSTDKISHSRVKNTR